MEQTHPSRSWTDVLKHRWPTVLGIAVAALTVFDLQGGHRTCWRSPMLMPVVFFGAAALDRRWVSRGWCSSPEWKFWSSSLRARKSSLR